MNDLIDRQAALDAMETWDKFGCDPDGKLVRYDDDKHYIPYVHYEDMVHAIKHLPSAQPEQRWIPCSERLPEQYGNYLISIHGEDEPDIGTINPNDKRGWSLCDANGFHWASDKKLIVTAWMPLPEPYKGGEQDDSI